MVEREIEKNLAEEGGERKSCQKIFENNVL